MKGKILVVEDDLPTRQLLKLWLSTEGYEVEFAADEPTALAFVQDWKPDAMLLDILLPAPVGFDICREAKRLADVPVMMMTARTIDSDAQKAKDAGADDFVQKPFDISDLIGRVTLLMKRQPGNHRTMMMTA